MLCASYLIVRTQQCRKEKPSQHLQIVEGLVACYVSDLYIYIYDIHRNKIRNLLGKKINTYRW